MAVAASSGARGRWAGLHPVEHKGWWITGGLLAQIIGVGAPIAYLLARAKHEDMGGVINRATLKLAWHDAIQQHAGLALLVVGALVFAAGSILLARPFVRSWLTLLVAVPLAAIAGVLVLGAAAVIVGALAAGLGELFDGVGGGGGGSSSSAVDTVADVYPYDSYNPRRRRKKETQQQP